MLTTKYKRGFDKKEYLDALDFDSQQIRQATEAKH